MSKVNNVLTKRIDIHHYSTQQGLLELQASLKDGWVIDESDTFNRSRGHHIFVSLIKSEPVEKAVEDKVVEKVVEKAAPKVRTTKATVTKVTTDV